MTSSLITKKRIAKAFKNLLATQDFQTISVVDIMKLAKIRRQTFYNHFVDKYQLMDWIFESELQERITDNLDFISGRQLLMELFLYFEQERYFYLQLFDSRGQNNFYDYFVGYCQILVTKIIKEYATSAKMADPQFLDFHQHYHSHALAQTIKDFLHHKQALPKPDYLISEICAID
ncbi:MULTISPECIES: dihydroxyacetone kinase transcriptional activator DhaS [unclassified Streptococcus]|uniref:dihydroxyacetone kinase transcriptional activator DhaS n=1 Tax=unclassified Streptococcus TaxID=2608887 RepID=UPI0011B43225|nr:MULTISPECIES: dihydroxyacetone kinase transcriptional activator DhaS [unclassified Streptococcus]TWS95305.1 dihydroxyacetone kinase transcriptional activator DhaS [Streptococcus sp. sy018]TWT12036.1 dihydroxyacetone kinase transcriptional activator DhaS [Streptococcus sp. sy004]TWT16414.1 dihydroxyacetone kinase transcriptional activator DhaS [Streptococcus sp. sy010]